MRKAIIVKVNDSQKGCLMAEKMVELDEMDEGFFDELEEEAEEQKNFADEHEQ